MRKEKRDSPNLVSDMIRKGGGDCPFIFIIPDPRPKSREQLSGVHLESFMFEAR